ncbi:hypothetical protein CPC08DRAFT_703534 [Agrocybe pediades]|nr:hypothetical protein CPC08DRAFT_703534 [Agrocybe pediades]
MVWTIKDLETLSLFPTQLLLPPPAYQKDDIGATTLGRGVAESRYSGGYSSEQIRLCLCGYEETFFCPYCEYDRTHRKPLVSESAPLETPSQADSDQTDELVPDAVARPRKLRKYRPEYQQLQYEALDVESLLSARPNSILSTHSGIPPPDSGLFPSSNPLSPPVERRTPRKLEKKDKRQRCTSFHSSPSSSSSNILLTPASRNVTVVKSKYFLKTKRSMPLGPRPIPASSSIDTDALVSLAWTGEIKSTLKASEVLLPGSEGHPSFMSSSPTLLSRITSSEDITSITSPSEKRPAVLRKQKDEDIKRPQPRPWTLAMAITDDGVSDEKLVEDLEAMRIKAKVSDSVIPDPHPFGISLSPPSYSSQFFDSFAEYPLQPDEVMQDLPSPSDQSWGAARQALLLCRELVRTERRYLASLKVLISNGTTTPPPPLMLSHLPGLITASDALLNLMEENPSVQGVSQAFLSCQNDLNDAFVSWCGVVGQFFKEEGSKNKNEAEETQQPHFLTTSPRSLSAESNLSIVVSEPNKIRKNVKARPSVRDLAILPTQRIMRYVLLFKELHSLAPVTLSSFAFVESAMRVADSIARNADMVQNHTTFK